MTVPDSRDFARAAERHGRWFTSAGTRLFFLDLGEGQGPPIAFLHGGLADHRAALFRVGAAASSRRLLLPDLRGSGRSIYAGELSWDQFADDLLALLASQGIARAVISGTSMGSAVALRFALRHPAHTAGLLLMSPLYPGADEPLPPAVSAAFRAMAEAGERALKEGIDALRPLFEALPSPIRDVALAMMRGFDPASVAATTRFLASSSQPFDSAFDLSAIDAPVLLIPGADPQHPPEIAALYARHLRHVTVIDTSNAANLDLVGQLRLFCA